MFSNSLRAALAALLFLVALPARAAISYVATGAFNFSNSSSVALNTPAGIANNNLEIMFVGLLDSNGLSTVNTPAGWTAITSVTHNQVYQSTIIAGYAFYRVASSEPGSYTVSASAGSGSVITSVSGTIVGFSGTATSSPINSFASALGAFSGGTQVTIPALTESFVSGEWYVAIGLSTGEGVPATITPTLSNVVSHFGSNVSSPTGDIATYLGNLVPGSSPGTEQTAGWNAGSAWQSLVGIGLSIKPLAVASSVGGLPLMGVGK